SSSPNSDSFSGSRSAAHSTTNALPPSSSSRSLQRIRSGTDGGRRPPSRAASRIPSRTRPGPRASARGSGSATTTSCPAAAKHGEPDRAGRAEPVGHVRDEDLVLAGRAQFAQPDGVEGAAGGVELVGPQRQFVRAGEVVLGGGPDGHREPERGEELGRRTRE